MPFLHKLELLCQAQGLSERTLAKQIGFDQSAISRWRKRGSLPRPEIIKKLADFFEIMVVDLVDDKKEVPSHALLAHLQKTSAAVTQLHSKNRPTGQATPDLQLGKKSPQQNRAMLANFLRARAKILRGEAKAMEQRAKQLD